jgi:chorismate synthase
MPGIQRPPHFHHRQARGAARILRPRIEVVRERSAGGAPDLPVETVKQKVSAFKSVRRQYDPVYQAIFASGRLRPEMRFLEKMAVLAQFEKEIPDLKRPPMDEEAVRREHGVHPKLNCPDLAAADEMYRRIIEITEGGDSSGGVVEVVATGAPAGMGEPILRKLDGEIGRMMSIIR